MDTSSSEDTSGSSSSMHETTTPSNISWEIIDKYFKENPYNLVAHHIDSYNNFYSEGIFKIFRENNPVKVAETHNESLKEDEQNQTLFYMGGKEGNRIYFGKPVIYDSNKIHYMYPNEARLRNMTYGLSVHYDVDVDYIYYDNGEQKTRSTTLSKIYLGNFPIMLHSNMCLLNGLATDVRFNMGECKNDYGGYFIVDGKEKSIICQESRADNMLYTKKFGKDDIYTYGAEIKSVSEDASKPMRTTAVKIVAPSTVLTNNQIVVEVPNVRKPVPLFILMRALGVLSDESIVKCCLLDLTLNDSFVDLLIPSVHDASLIFNQMNALQYISTFTKRQTISNTFEILMNAFLPHVGELNFLDKAYFLGYMVHRLLKVSTNQEQLTNRDNFKYKRIELSGALIYDLFREYYLIQIKKTMLVIEKTDYYKKIGDVVSFIEDNQDAIFKDRDVEKGMRKAFKGSWGSQANTKRVGVVQDINRLSWWTFMSQLRRINLPLSASAKVVGPHLLNNSQWGYIDPLDTPDGGNVGLHKHLAISCMVTSGYSSFPLIKLLRENTLFALKILAECSPEYIASCTKTFVNGNWIGVVEQPIQLVNYLKLLRRNGIIPIYTSITFHYENNEIYLYTDSGRLTRPIYYINDGKISVDRKTHKELDTKLKTGEYDWYNVVSGFYPKTDKLYDIRLNKVYKNDKLYSNLFKSVTAAASSASASASVSASTSASTSSTASAEKEPEINLKGAMFDNLRKYASLVDYIDVSEEENSLIATNMDVSKTNKYYTHVEIDPSLILGIMGNSIIYPENNPLPRNQFSCGQSKQACSVYHTNAAMRFDKMGVVLNYGQVPLIKSHYLEYINKSENPYGVNTIVAIMSYTGYNVEDAILINEGSLKRGLFNTTYYTMYESTEESSNAATDSTNSSTFANVLTDPTVVKLKTGYDYSFLDEYGLIKENTEMNDKIVVIGQKNSSGTKTDLSEDASVMPKKGQLGVVDKVFMTDTEEGSRLAKVRVREERIPAIGDKMASRAGQKGTIGLVIPEENMPFTADGLRPDIIINPHAIPSRMTIGQLIESLFGKMCALYGGFGDCTAFAAKGPNYDTYGAMLTKLGYHNSGNQLLYNGMTGDQLEANVFIGPTYYMRLKHMVKDKINYRARGPKTMLTRQTVQGRSNDGGMRVGEMERDGILAHGASAFLNESYMVRGDEYYMAVCNKTGMIAIYNESLNLFLSPYSDGPIKFSDTLSGNKNIQNISRFGRSFSIVRVPYALKLLIQELQTMNVQMRIITDNNVDQLMNLCYSNNINKLLHKEDNLRMIVHSHNVNLNIKQHEYNMTPIEIQRHNASINKGEKPEFQTFEGLPVPNDANEFAIHLPSQNSIEGEQGQKQAFTSAFKNDEEDWWKTGEETNRQGQANGASGANSSGVSINNGWEQFFSTSKNLPYWFNKQLNKSVWENPNPTSANNASSSANAVLQKPLSHFDNPELNAFYLKIKNEKIKTSIDHLSSQEDKELMLKRYIKLRNERLAKEMIQIPEHIAPTNIFEVEKPKTGEKDKDKDKKDNGSGSGSDSNKDSSSSNDKKVIKLN